MVKPLLFSTEAAISCYTTLVWNGIENDRGKGIVKDPRFKNKVRYEAPDMLSKLSSGKNPGQVSSD